MDRYQVEEILASWSTSKRTRGYAFTFGGTDGFMLGRKGWFDAVLKVCLTLCKRGWFDAELKGMVMVL